MFIHPVCAPPPPPPPQTPAALHLEPAPLVAFSSPEVITFLDPLVGVVRRLTVNTSSFDCSHRQHVSLRAPLSPWQPAR